MQQILKRSWKILDLQTYNLTMELTVTEMLLKGMLKRYKIFCQKTLRSLQAPEFYRELGWDSKLTTARCLFFFFLLNIFLGSRWCSQLPETPAARYHSPVLSGTTVLGSVMIAHCTSIFRLLLANSCRSFQICCFPNNCLEPICICVVYFFSLGVWICIY